ncbi:hypothetical protein [Shewanella sp.]|uniref:hypothetical protein n=1 Tax=Shewanella sp. TaxID=50422 RepID=UPI00258E57A0|nr:hypothetical protein [Shewanella sp.]MCJ8304952.1 hypothetical protein [Shewanella sp.]
MKNTYASAWCISAMLLSTMPVIAADKSQLVPSKPATQYTKDINEKVLTALPFADREDFDNASRGFIAKPDTLTIKNQAGQVGWDLEQYKTYISLTGYGKP